jgi:hypothetical protein
MANLAKRDLHLGAAGGDWTLPDMRRLSCLLPFLAAGIGFLTPSARAIDIDPSRDNIPNKDQVQGGGGNRFSIFSGDPARIQRANSIDFKDFSPTLTLAPAEISLAARRDEGTLATDNVRANFSIKNTGKRTYTLSFPNTQRYELKILNPTGQLVYQWSLDKKFTDDVGMVMVNPTDRIGYIENLSLSKLYAPLVAGDYTVLITLANYPEVAAKAVFKVKP